MPSILRCAAYLRRKGVEVRRVNAKRAVAHVGDRTVAAQRSDRTQAGIAKASAMASISGMIAVSVLTASSLNAGELGLPELIRFDAAKLGPGS
jgi:hypothetical protein